MGRRLAVWIAAACLAGMGGALGQATEWGFQFNYLQGLDSNPEMTNQGDESWENVYSLLASPSLRITSPHQELWLEYAFGRQRMEGTSLEGVNLQILTARYRRDFSPKFTLELADSASYSPDFTPDLIYLGSPSTPEPPPVGEPGIESQRVPRVLNQFNARGTFKSGPSTDWIFSYGNQIVHFYNQADQPYPENDTTENTASGAYRRHLSPRLDLGAAYTFDRMTFEEFGDTNSHSVQFLLGWTIRPSVSLEGGAGPAIADTELAGARTTFFNGWVSLTKRFRRGSITGQVSRTLSPTYGVGGAALTNMAQVNLRREFYRHWALEVSGAYVHYHLLGEEDATIQNFLFTSAVFYEPSRWLHLFAAYHYNDQDSNRLDYASFDRNQVFFGVSLVIRNIERNRL